MAVSELQSRLEHLVTYSSQLIFISGDSVASQQRSLQTFVGQQSENTEIAFINAESQLTVSQYRQQIVRQLLGHDATLLNRPLNELLSPLNQHDGPVLIFICDAQHIPQSFLQELWELVLQSRFAANKQHLNVLLFGESSWTEKAKAWLPANNRDKPLLLSTESIAAQDVPHQSELDKMIALKRQQFEQRLKDRANANTYVPPSSNLSTWWFRLIIAFAFLSVFAGIMLWQYSDQFDAVVENFQAPPVTDAPPSEQEPSDDATGNSESAPRSQNPQEQSLPEELIKYEIVEHTPELANREKDTQQTNEPGQSAEHQLVTSWQQAVSDMDNRNQGTSSTESNDNTVVEVIAAHQDHGFAEATEASQLSEPAFPEDEEGLSDTLDYQIEDIVSVDQLPVADNQSRESADVTPETPEQEIPASQDGVEVQMTDTNVQALQTPDQPPTPDLLSLPDNHYVIQIAGLKDEDVLQEFLTDNRLTGQVWTYKTQRYGGDWHVVIFKASYASIEQARNEMRQLPEAMQRGTPFVKSVNRVHNEIQIH